MTARVLAVTALAVSIGLFGWSAWQLATTDETCPAVSPSVHEDGC